MNKVKLENINDWLNSQDDNLLSVLSNFKKSKLPEKVRVNATKYFKINGYGDMPNYFCQWVEIPISEAVKLNLYEVNCPVIRFAS